jgi:3-methyladenine DNA glycosylase AlkC
MAEPFKNLLNADLVRLGGQHLQRAWPGFDRAHFEAQALGGLEALELKARALQISSALQATLPTDFDQAAGILESSLAPAPASAPDTPGTPKPGDAGLAGWIVWPMTDFIARVGQAHPERALQALHAMTQRFTAEWAVRPFIVHHGELAFATLARWAEDPSAHVRRLVSEGSRPRLPWGLQLKSLIADPSPTLPLLEALQDDPSEYVRRSVANHLNDIAKDHPGLVAAWVSRHLADAPAERRALLRHASRTLIKRGDGRMLAAWGLGAPLRGKARIAVSPTEVALGGSVRLAIELTSTTRNPQPLVVDYAVHHVKASGATSAKVFKGWAFTLGAEETRALHKTHSMRQITTRRYYAGEHRVELLVNGRAVAGAAFGLSL